MFLLLHDIPGPKSNASGPKSLAMASMMQTMMESSSDSESESEMRPGPNASKLQMNETVSPVKKTDGPSAAKPSYTGPMSMSSKLNTMMDSSSDSSGDETDRRRQVGASSKGRAREIRLKRPSCPGPIRGPTALKGPQLGSSRCRRPPTHEEVAEAIALNDQVEGKE